MKTQTADDASVYTVEEAGAKLGLSRNGSYNAVKRGEIPSIRLGRLLRVPRTKFDEMLAERELQKAESAPQILRMPKRQRTTEPKIAMGVTVPISLNNMLIKAAIANDVPLSHEVTARLLKSFERKE